MVSYQYVDAADVEPRLRVLRPIRKSLGLGSVGVNEIELPPGFERYPEHDELKTNQDELYIVLEGAATMSVDGETIELVPGRYVWVTPESRRQITPGSEGVRFVVVGAPADAQPKWRH